AIYLLLDRGGRPGAERPKGAAFFLALLIWLCSDLIGLYTVGRAYNYYLTQVAPLASLLPLFILSRLEGRAGKAVYLSFLFALALVLSADFAQAMLDLRSQRWVPREVRQSAAAANYIKGSTRGGDRLFVYRASNVDIFFLSQRLSPNGIYMYVDMIGQFMHDPEMEARKRTQFLANLPAVIVVDPRDVEDLADPFLDETLKKYYTLQTTVEGLHLYARTQH